MSQISPAKVKVAGINQVALVVKDIEKTVEDYWKILGIGPWNIFPWEAPTVFDRKYYGKPTQAKEKIALAQVGAVQLELVQSVEGNSIYQDFLTEHGEGLHHVAICVDDLDAARAEFLRRGFESIQGGPIPGLNRDGSFEYFDARRDFGTVIELLDWPEEMEEQPTYPQPDPPVGSSCGCGCVGE